MPLQKEIEYTLEDIYALPEGERAELIDGQLYLMAAPTRRHQNLVVKAGAKIFNYIESHGGDCEVNVAPFAVFLGNETDYVEPDVTVVCDPSRLDEKGCHGAPDWIIEVVSPSSRRMDYMIKLFKYRTEGVREYWIVDPDRDRVTVYSFNPNEDLEDVNEYTLRDAVPVGLYDDLTIQFED